MSGKDQLGAAKAKVISSRLIAPRVRLVRLRAELLLGFEPGQYVGLVRLGADESPHYFTIASAPMEDPTFELCMGLGSSGFAEDVSPGDELGLLGPLGPRIVPRNEAGSVLLVATGTGASLLRACLLAKLWGSRRLVATIGHRSEADILFHDEFKSMYELDYRPVLSQPGAGWNGQVGYVQDAIQGIIEQGDASDFDVVVCGQKLMVADLVRQLVDLGVSEGAIFAQGY